MFVKSKLRIFLQSIRMKIVINIQCCYLHYLVTSIILKNIHQFFIIDHCVFLRSRNSSWTILFNTVVNLPALNGFSNEPFSSFAKLCIIIACRALFPRTVTQLKMDRFFRVPRLVKIFHSKQNLIFDQNIEQDIILRIKQTTKRW